MATRNIQMNILTDSGSYDTLYPQTTASQAGARPSTWTPTASQVGALPITGGTLTGDLRLKDNSNYGRKLYFGDGEYAFIGELSDDNLTIKAKNIELTTSESLTNNGSVIGSSNTDSVKYQKGIRQGTGTISYNITTNFTPLFLAITSILPISSSETVAFLQYSTLAKSNNSYYWPDYSQSLVAYFCRGKGIYMLGGDDSSTGNFMEISAKVSETSITITAKKNSDDLCNEIDMSYAYLVLGF